jgi:REP element-mobilizing transposase RayT
MEFQPFDPKAERSEYRRHLPHWSQPGCTYFLTFRLADSVPHAKLREWHEERRHWLQEHGLNTADDLPRLPVAQQREFYEYFTRRMHEWLDAGLGSCLLRESQFARLVVEALLFFDGTRCAIGDFVVMPNHVHLLATPLAKWKLPALLHSWKRHSAREINRLRGKEGALWMDETFDHAVRSDEQLAYFRRYIVQNPIRARLQEGEFLVGVGSDRADHSH